MSYRETQFRCQAALAGLHTEEPSSDEDFEEERGQPRRLWLVKWPNGDCVICSAGSRQEVFRVSGGGAAAATGLNPAAGAPPSSRPHLCPFC